MTSKHYFCKNMHVCTTSSFRFVCFHQDVTILKSFSFLHKLLALVRRRRTSPSFKSKTHLRAREFCRFHLLSMRFFVREGSVVFSNKPDLRLYRRSVYLCLPVMCAVMYVCNVCLSVYLFVCMTLCNMIKKGNVSDSVF